MATPKHGPGARGLLFQTLSGRSGSDVSGSTTGDLRGQLLAAFGASKRDPSRPDTKAAADALGVTPRTVQRWIAGEGHQRIAAPRPAIAARIAKAARQAASTRRGRASSTAAARTAARSARTMTRISIRGMQGVDPTYYRQRQIVMQLSPSQTVNLFDAYVAGGENGALGWLADNCDSTYGVASWGFGDVQGFSFL